MIRRASALLATILCGGALAAPDAALGQTALQRLERQLTQQAPTPAAPGFAQPEPPKLGDLPPPPAEEPGYLGIIAVDHDTQGRGVRLVDVLAGGPAALGGLKIGDLITSIDGTAIADRGAMGEVMQGRLAGESVTFVIVREGEGLRLDVTLSKRPPPEERRFANFGLIGVDTTAIGSAPTPAPANSPPQPHMPQLPATVPSANPPVANAPAVGAARQPSPAVQVPVNSLPAPNTATPMPAEPVEVATALPVGPGVVNPNGPIATAARTGMLGIRTARVTPELQLSLNLPEPRGALVIEVRPGSPAQAAGIPTNAVIVAVDAARVDDPNDLMEAVRERGPGAEVKLSFYRYGQLYERRIKLEAPLGGTGPVIATPPVVATPPTTATPPVATAPPTTSGGPAFVAPVTSAPASTTKNDAEAEALRREVAELERRLSDIKQRLGERESSPAPKQ
ncbi:MAG: PDZ domain-containing protein [Pirellulales bacterium]